MAKVDTDPQVQAVEALLGGLSLKRKQELVERNDRLRFQFLQTQKTAPSKAREAQLNAFLSGVVGADKKIRELVFNAWLKDNSATLGDVPDLPERFKRDADVGPDEGDAEADLKDATAALKKWAKASSLDLVNVYARLGPYEFPAKALTGLKKPKAKDSSGDDGAEGEASEAPAASSGVSEAALAALRAEMDAQRAKLEAQLEKQAEETNKFKRLLEENKEKRKAELAEFQEKARAELAAKQADWQRTEALLRKELADFKKSVQDQADKTSKVRDELLPLRQQLEKAEKEAKRAQTHHQEALEQVASLEAEVARLTDRLKALESAQQQLVAKERQLQRFQTQGASVALTSADNLKIWEEALNEQEVKEAFKRTFNPDNIAVSHYDHDEKDLHVVWRKLLEAEQAVVERFFALPFDELFHPTDDFRDLITNFIELKDSLVAREQLAHMVNYVGNKFLSNSKQTV